MYGLETFEAQIIGLKRLKPGFPMEVVYNHPFRMECEHLDEYLYWFDKLYVKEYKNDWDVIIYVEPTTQRVFPYLFYQQRKPKRKRRKNYIEMWKNYVDWKNSVSRNNLWIRALERSEGKCDSGENEERSNA